MFHNQRDTSLTTHISLRTPALVRLRVQPVPIQRVAPRWLARACRVRALSGHVFSHRQFAKFLEIVNNRMLSCRVVELSYIVDFFIKM